MQHTSSDFRVHAPFLQKNQDVSGENAGDAQRAEEREPVFFESCGNKERDNRKENTREGCTMRPTRVRYELNAITEPKTAK